MSDASRLIGTWKQLSGVVEEVGSGVSRSNLSAAPSGFITFSADGRIVNLTVDSSRSKPARNPPTVEEAAELFRTLIAYAGTYKVQGDKVIYQLDVSWNELWTGTEQVRFWRIEGDRLHVSTPEIINPLTGKKSIHRLVFEKVQPQN